MGILRKLSTKAGEHKRRIAATLAFTGIALAVFVAGAWAGSSGALTFGQTPAVATHAMHSPTTDADKPMPPGEMGPNKPMKPGMPMHKSDKMCCDKP